MGIIHSKKLIVWLWLIVGFDLILLGNEQPSDGISKVVFGGQVTDEEVESLLKR